MAKTTEMVEVPVSSLIPYERNAKKHPEEQIEKIKKSILEFGFISPCLIDKKNRIIAGHGRVEASKQLGIEKVPCVYIEGLTEEQRRAYILADNKLTELGGWDLETVSEELAELKALDFDITTTGFSIDDILFDEFEDDLPIKEEEKEDVPNIVKLGEVWKLGEHRLMCGDSTNPEDVAKLMDGKEADLLETDPPYNVSLGQTEGHPLRLSEAKQLHRRTDGLIITNDDWETEEDFINFLVRAFTAALDVMKPGAVFYIWYADTQALNFRRACHRAGMTIRENLIWVKNIFAFGRQDYQWRHEPCFYGWKGGAGHYFIDLRSLTTVQEADLENKEKAELIELLQNLLDDIGTVFHEDKPSRNALHPTMKPVGLIKKQIRNSTREGELVLDLFGGSGSTLIACEQMNRKCNIMEYDEFYASAIVRRWEEETGEKAVKIDG